MGWGLGGLGGLGRAVTEMDRSDLACLGYDNEVSVILDVFRTFFLFLLNFI